MDVIGCADDAGIDAFFVVEHDAKIFEPPGLRVLRELLGGVVIIHIAKRDHVVAFSGHRINVGSALAADADAVG